MYDNYTNIFIYLFIAKYSFFYVTNHFYMHILNISLFIWSNNNWLLMVVS